MHRVPASRASAVTTTRPSPDSATPAGAGPVAAAQTGAPSSVRQRNRAPYQSVTNIRPAAGSSAMLARMYAMHVAIRLRIA